MITEAMPRPNEFSPPEQQESAWSFLMFAWRRKALVVLMVVVGLGLGYLYFLRETPIYQSTAQILLVHRHAKLPIEGLEVNTGYDSTHELLIRSPMVAKKAVEKNDLKSLSTLNSDAEPWVAVVSGLSVSSESRNESSGDIIELSFSSRSQNDCQKVLEGVIAAYQDFLGDTYKDVSQEAIDLINKAKDELDSQINDTQKEYTKFLAENPVLPAADDSLLTQIASIRDSAVVAISTTQAKIRHIDAALKRGGSREALALMVGDLEKVESKATPIGAAKAGEKTTNNIEEQIFPLLLQEEMLLKTYGKDHPKLEELRSRIALTRQHLLGLTSQAAVSDTKIPQRDFFEIYLESLNEQIKMHQQTIAEMNDLFAKESESVKRLAGARRQDENFRESISSKREFYKAVVKRLEEIELVKDNNSVRVQVIYEPGLGHQIKPDLKKIMSSAGMLGMLLGLGLAFITDCADRRFRGPDEIRSDLGLPVIGHIPVIPVYEPKKSGKATEKERELSPVLRMLHQPRGRIAEAYRAVRTALYFSTRGTGLKVIQITSPSPGDGKTTLACNLAVSIANSGKQVVLLDADFRRPRCHRVLGIDNTQGITDVLDGTAELTEVLYPTTVSNLFLLPCGKRPENPSELLISPQFEQLLGLIREKFDFVIIDTPPVLAVTDPLNVVSRVDGVLLVMRLTKKARVSSRRALAALEEMGANMLGVVVNGIGAGRGFSSSKYSQEKYGYGNYGYGYAYGVDRYQSGGTYEYGYGDGENYGDVSHYYEESDHEPTKGKNAKSQATSRTNGKA